MTTHRTEVFIVAAVRTAIGTFGGSLKDVPLTQLATTAVRAALERSGADPGDIGHLVMGNVISTEPRDAYLSRVAAIEAGIPQETPSFNVNRLCGSGLQAIVSAAQALLLNETDIAIGAGAESMSRAPYYLPAARWGARMGDTQATDYMLGILNDPFHRTHMAITAENVAERDGISREMQDALAIERHWRILKNISFHWGRCWPLDIALWDLAGKITRQPCWKLLGGLKSSVRAYASSGTLRSPAELAELFDLGYHLKHVDTIFARVFSAPPS